MSRWLQLKRFITRHLLALNLVVLAASLSLFVLARTDRAEPAPHAGNYPMLSKRIFVDNPNDLIINFVPLRSQLEGYRESATPPMGIYFEYLASGTSVGVDSNDSFFGASLLKLPVAMKTYRLAEDGKLDMGQEVVIEQKHIDKGFGELWKRGVGSKVKVAEAVRLSVAESDNTADHILRDLVEPRPVSDVFDYLDVDTGVASGPGGGVTPRGYSSVLRALYLSSYLSYKDSNELLDIMTTSPYDMRIGAGVPKEVKVAHKVGIYKDPNNGSNEVHADCGIVYVPKRPYILCIMINDSIEESTKHMATISKLVYDYVSSVNQPE